MPHSEFQILVLAAGRGRRMGGPKALAMVDGVPWWMIQSARLCREPMRVTWVVSPPVEEVMRAHTVALAGGRLVTGDPETPMFDSVVRGLRAMRDERPRGVYVLPVDVPAPAPVVWAALAEAGGVAAPAYRGKRGHPVLLPWKWIEEKLGEELKGTTVPVATTSGSGRRLDELIAADVKVVEVDEPEVVANLNTPEDVKAWQEEGMRRIFGP